MRHVTIALRYEDQGLNLTSEIEQLVALSPNDPNEDLDRVKSAVDYAVRKLFTAGPGSNA